MKFAEPTASVPEEAAVGVSELCEQLGWDAGGGRKSMSNGNHGGSGAKPRRHYDENYKRHAVELTLRGDRSVTQVAGELGVAESMLYDWRRKYAPRPGAQTGAPQSLDQATQEIARLRSEVVRLQEREIILKKSLGILSETPESGMPKLKR
jgi:transposase